MHDPWMDRLSEYLDASLVPDEAAAMERHLAECDACRSTLHELRSVVALAQSLEDSPPDRDLWDGIASRIAAPAAADPSVLPLRRTAAGSDQYDRRQARRRFSFTIPELAAAAMLLVALSAGAVWWLAGRSAMPVTTVGAIAHTAGDVPDNGRLVTDVPAGNGINADIAELERTLDDARELLDPATVDVIERSLESIDQAIGDARAALAADPDNPHLTRQLDNTTRKKLEILRRAHRVQRVGT